MSARHRKGPIHFQQQLARQAMQRGAIDAARIALRTLRAEDFAGGAAVSQAFLAVLQDGRATDAAVHEAVVALLHLRPIGGG